MASRHAISLVKKSSAEFLQLRCHVRPGASKVREGVAAVTDEAIELCVSAPPQDGKANKAVIEILSEVGAVPTSVNLTVLFRDQGCLVMLSRATKSDLQITHGSKTRDKTISVASTCFQRIGAQKNDDILVLVKEKLLRDGLSQG
ncbi:YggU-like protein [Camillea tinctor]|nr:YggU-like protein [Camillea tinctor]